MAARAGTSQGQRLEVPIGGSVVIDGRRHGFKARVVVGFATPSVFGSLEAAQMVPTHGVAAMEASSRRVLVRTAGYGFLEDYKVSLPNLEERVVSPKSAIRDASGVFRRGSHAPAFVATLGIALRERDDLVRVYSLKGRRLSDRPSSIGRRLHFSCVVKAAQEVAILSSAFWVRDGVPARD